MDIISDYRISAHQASDDDLELVAERVRRAYASLREREQEAVDRRPQRAGFFRRLRHA